MGNAESEEKNSLTLDDIARRCRRALTLTSSAKGGRGGWYTKHDLKGLCMVLREGDLLEIERDWYAHWAVCVAVGAEAVLVIHFTIDQGIRLDKLVDVLEDDECRVNNAKDGNCPVKSPEDIVESANYYLKNPMEFGEYSKASNNCEHFATWCRYNRKFSKQVRTVVEATVAAAVGVAAVAVAIGVVLDANKGKNDNKQ